MKKQITSSRLLYSRRCESRYEILVVRSLLSIALTLMGVIVLTGHTKCVKGIELQLLFYEDV